MPPKKAPSSLASQKSLLPTTAAALSSSRQPLPAPVLPASDSLAPLWAPSSRPRELFPEWPSATALTAENWYTAEAPFKDSLIPNELLVPRDQEPSSIAWKRPSQFLPPITEPAHAQSAPSVPVPAAPEPKAPAKRGGAAAATPASKKGAVEPEPVKKAPPKHAHVFYSDPHDPDHKAAAAQATTTTPVTTTAAVAGHASTGHAAGAGSSHQTHPPHSNPAASSAAAAHPPNTAQHPVAPDHSHDHHHIPRDFRRLWSADELEEIAKWRLEEARIEREKEQRERVYMGFEDAIAYIVNERPRGFAQEEDVDAEDLVDDGEDDENNGENGGGAGDAISNDSSPWGILPPARVEITPNAICRPEFPHGDIVHGDMASLFRIVEQLFDTWTSHETTLPSPTTEQLPSAFLWRAIYPQDANGVPIYNPGGKYLVKLFVFGKWRRVDIDDKLPVDAEGNIVYLTSSMKSEIWPALLTKALLKVMHWLGIGGSDAYQANQSNDDNNAFKQEGDDERGGGAIRMANTVVSALTGWKISCWQPEYQENATGESMLQQLLQYIPSSHAPDESSETSADGEEQLDTDGESAPYPNSPTKPPTEMKPRAVICCGSERGNHVLYPGEAALVTNIVGDTENTMIKFTSLKGSSSVLEEMLAVDKLEFLLIHPPFKNRDLHLQHWTATKNEAAAGSSDDPSHALLWTPFPNPTTQFVIVKMPKPVEEQAASDATSSEERADPTELYHHARPVEVVFTLTRIPPADPLASTSDTRLRSSREIAKHLQQMDPHGSLILVQEHVQNNQSRTKKPQAPMVITLNTSASTRVLLPFLPGGEDHVFRVYPQQSLCYGYALQMESHEKVDFQEPSTYWRNVCDVQVVNSDGAYPVLLPNTWNILFKHSVELAAPPDDSEPDKPHHVDLYVDLHLSDAMLGQYVHIAIVDDATSEVTKLSSLCSSVSLPVRDPAHPLGFTIIVDCASQEFHVPEGKWHLTLGSNWLFKGSSSHPMKLTAFEGQYEANKPLLCFRDVLTAPKKAIWTSFELQLVTENTGGDTDENTGGDLSDSLAVKLEVMDYSMSEQLLSECFATKSVRLLQLPRGGGGGDQDDGGGYIIQGTIDRSRCVVPEELCSLRPFRNRVGSESTRQQEIKESNDDGAGGDSDERGAAAIQTSLPSARSRSSSIKWRLNCWSAEDVKLDVDRTKENKLEAICASWAEAAKDRNSVMNGAVSRLLFLGKLDAAGVKMKHDGVPEDQAKRVQARFEWLEAASAKMHDGVYLEQRVRGRRGIANEERMKTADDFQEEDRLLQEEIVAAQSQLAQKREDRLAAREQRAQEVKELVQSIREQRSAALKKRLKLWQQQRDAILSA